MDKLTKTYRENQFKRLDTNIEPYKPALKIVTLGASTNWLDVTDHELKQIQAILTGRK